MRTVLPAPVRYPGMAADRWWQFEDARVNLNRIEGDADELLRLAARRLLAAVLERLVRRAGRARARRHLLPRLAGRHRRVRRAHDRSRTTAARHAPSPSGGCSSSSPFYDMFFLPPVLADSLSGDPVEEVLLHARRGCEPGLGRRAPRAEPRRRRVRPRRAYRLRGAARPRPPSPRRTATRCATASPRRCPTTGSRSQPVRIDPSQPAGEAAPRQGAAGRGRRPRLLTSARPHPRARPCRLQPVRGGGAARRRARRRGRTSTPAGSTAPPCSGSAGARARGAARVPAGCASTASRTPSAGAA